MLHFPTSADIIIEIDGQKIAVAQKYRAQTTRESRYVEAFGASEPVGTVGGRMKHVLELTRVSSLADTLKDGMDFHSMSGFNVVIQKPYSQLIFSGCEWASIDEVANLGSVVLESVSIVATSRMEIPR